MVDQSSKRRRKPVDSSTVSEVSEPSVTRVLLGSIDGIVAQEFSKLTEHADVGLLSAFVFPGNLEIMLESNADWRLGL